MNDPSFDLPLDVTVGDFVLFCERTIDFMIAAVNRLNDAQVVTAPAVAGMNSPFALVIHALGATEWWTGHMLCGHPTSRVRDEEFVSTGTVQDLTDVCAGAKGRLRELAPQLAQAKLHGSPVTSTPLVGEWTVGSALLHTYEELAQHLGHLQITVDLVLAAAATLDV